MTRPALDTFDWVNAVPDPGAFDPMFLLLALVAIVAAALASAIGWIVWPFEGEPRVQDRRGGFQ